MTRLDQLENQIERLRRRAGSLDEISRKYWTARRIVLVSGVLLAMALCGLAGNKAAWFVGALLALVFSVVTVYHNRVRDSLTRNSLLIEIKQVQIARIQLDWERIPPADLSAPTVSGHPFETDLDLTGERSLHRLIDGAVTREGSERLKSWLLSARPDVELIERRQALIRELKAHHGFRDKLQLLSAVARLNTGRRTSLWNSKMLVEWIARDERKDSLLPTVVYLSALSALNITCIVLASLHLIPPLWPLTFVIYAGAMILNQS